MVDPVMPLASLWAAEPTELPRPRRAFAERLARARCCSTAPWARCCSAAASPSARRSTSSSRRARSSSAPIHREAIAAGADIIETNTFGANRFRLAPYGLADRAGRLNRRAAQLAREARDVAAVGTCSSPGRSARSRPPSTRPDASPRRTPSGPPSGSRSTACWRAASTCSSSRPPRRSRSCCCHRGGAAPARTCRSLASMTFGEDLVAIDGTTPETAARALAAAGVDGLGVNCGVGPGGLPRGAGADGRGDRGAPLLIMPNAGLPSRVEGQFVYAADPAYFAGAVPRFLEAGARLIGGCCGTTPEHIAAMRQALDRELARASGTATAIAAAPTLRRPVRHRRDAWSRERARASATARRRRRPPASPAGLADGRFVISVEIDPPRSVRIERTLEAARAARRRPASTWSTSATARWPACAWARWPSPSASSTTWTSSAWSTSRPATAT